MHHAPNYSTNILLRFLFSNFFSRSDPRINANLKSMENSSRLSTGRVLSTEVLGRSVSRRTCRSELVALILTVDLTHGFDGHGHAVAMLVHGAVVTVLPIRHLVAHASNVHHHIVGTGRCLVPLRECLEIADTVVADHQNQIHFLFS